MMASSPNSDAARWRAVHDRDRAADGQFWYGVLTTGIYCRPHCPSRPKRENLRFFETCAAARTAGAPVVAFGAFANTVIRSRKRLTYKQAYAFLFENDLAAIRAAVQDASPLTHTDFIGSWMRAIKDVTRIVPREEGCDDILHERHIERASIEHSLANLRTFPWIRMKENKREIALHGVWFDISLGELHAYDEDAAEWGAVRGA